MDLYGISSAKLPPEAYQGTDPAPPLHRAPDDGLGFADLLDAINPLQHIPLVGSLYRSLTGDGISAAARAAGGILYGGIAGLVSAAFNAVLENGTGRDLGGHILAALDGATEAASEMPATVVAAASPGRSSTAATAPPAPVPVPVPDAPVLAAAWSEPSAAPAVIDLSPSIQHRAAPPAAAPVAEPPAMAMTAALTGRIGGGEPLWFDPGQRPPAPTAGSGRAAAASDARPRWTVAPPPAVLAHGNARPWETPKPSPVAAPAAAAKYGRAVELSEILRQHYRQAGTP